MEILKQRRTIRKYQQKDISSDLLNDLLDSAFRASTVGNDYEQGCHSDCQ